MSRFKTIPIEQVEPDIDKDQSSVIYNPLEEDFKCSFGGKEITLAAKTAMIWPTTKAYHVAKHLAIKIVLGNSYAYLQENFKKKEDPDYWRKVHFGKVKRSSVQLVIDAILVKVTESEEAMEVLKTIQDKAEKQPDVAKNLKNPPAPSTEEEDDLPPPPAKTEKESKSKADDTDEDSEEDEMIDEDEETDESEEDEDGNDEDSEEDEEPKSGKVTKKPTAVEKASGNKPKSK